MKRFTFTLLCLLSLMTAVAAGDINPYRVYGDMDGNNKVNINDVTALIQYLLTGQPVAPESTHSPNMTIAEFKAKHWQDARNYIDTIVEEEIIHGWVTSSDESGSIYKTLYITDESGQGLTISINQSNLYQYYPIGQELILPMKGYWVGKYNGQQLLGYPQWYEPLSTWEANFLPQSVWETLVELNGFPDPERGEVQPVDVNITDFQGKNDSETLLNYQSKLVCLKNVRFVEANGIATYAILGASTNRTIQDKDGNTLLLRVSNYADFADDVLPQGSLNIVGQLSTYGTTWQLTLRSAADVTVVDPGEDPEPVDPVTGLNEGFGDGIPSEWANVVVSGDKQWYQAYFMNNSYAAMTGYKGMQPPFDAWLITPALDFENDADKVLSFRTQVNAYGSTTSMLEVYLLDSRNPATATLKVKLDPVLATPPVQAVYSDWTESGDIDLSQWNDGVYYIGFRYYASEDVNYATWCVDDVKFCIEQANGKRADFETMGLPNSAYSSRTSVNGWVAENSALLSGGEMNTNPYFEFIGFMNNSTTEYAIAPTLNGKTTAVGTLVSPVLHGGMNRLCFNYGAAFTDAVLSFRVDVKQGGEVIKTWTVTNDNVTKWEVYPFDEACSIDGDFTIEITNLSPSGSTSNKDRVSIWNLTWESGD